MNEQTKVNFIGGPYDGRDGNLPFLPPVLVAYEGGDIDTGTTPGPPRGADFTMTKYTYMLRFPNGDQEPFAYELVDNDVDPHSFYFPSLFPGS